MSHKDKLADTPANASFQLPASMAIPEGLTKILAELYGNTNADKVQNHFVGQLNQKVQFGTSSAVIASVQRTGNRVTVIYDAGE